MIITNRINTHFTNLIGDENFANALPDSFDNRM